MKLDDYLGIVILILTGALAASIMLCGETAEPVPEDRAARYEREEWRHWLDFDTDCQDTRQEVLIRDSLDPAELAEGGCKVVRGRWVDPYTGREFTDPGDVHIDHRVALREAFYSRVDWTELERRVFANDMENLVVAEAAVNMQKSAKPPHEWMPPVGQCEYLSQRVSTQQKYAMRVTWEEAGFVLGELEVCTRPVPGYERLGP
jgi:hypothetical protein